MYFSKEALFHDETSDFLKMQKVYGGYIYTFILRTGRESVAHAYIAIDGKEHEMKKISTGKIFDEYSFDFFVEKGQIKYHFRVESEGVSLYYNYHGASDEMTGAYEFHLMVGYDTPDWAKGAVMYQIFTDRFYNGNKSNDVLTGEYAYIGEQVEQVEDWNSNPKPTDVRRFYGGDIQGVWEKLDYLEQLGIEVIYFNPLFVSPSNHKYDTQDYDYIDPHFGVIVKDEGNLLEEDCNDNTKASRYICRVTDRQNLEASNEFFAKFVKEVHRRGMKVIIDGVFNHCGSFNKWMDREGIYKLNGNYDDGAFMSKESPYNTFFKFTEDDWPNNTHYEGWWNYETLPKLNYEDSEKLCEYIIKIAKKWVSPPYNVDGWRLDVAADLGHSISFNHTFWKRFRKAVKEANPNAIILAEHYGDASSWLVGDEWDTVMNYDAFMEPVTWFLTGVDKHSDRVDYSLKGNGDVFIYSIAHHMASFQANSMLIAMNELSNHDHSRFLTRTNGKAGRLDSDGPEAAEQNVNISIMKEAVVMQMTLPGAPTVYYGDEVGLCGWTDPDNRRPYPWGNENFELLEFHRDMIKIHKENKALKIGAFKPLKWQKDILSYARFQGDNILVVIVNNAEEERMVSVPVWQVGVADSDTMDRIMLTKEFMYNIGRIPCSVENGSLEVIMPAQSAAIYRKRV